MNMATHEQCQAARSVSPPSTLMSLWYVVNDGRSVFSVGRCNGMVIGYVGKNGGSAWPGGCANSTELCIMQFPWKSMLQTDVATTPAPCGLFAKRHTQRPQFQQPPLFSLLRRSFAQQTATACEIGNSTKHSTRT
jgi:hypothetical protein